MQFFSGSLRSPALFTILSKLTQLKILEIIRKIVPSFYTAAMVATREVNLT